MRKEMRRAEREASRRLLEAGDFDDNYFASPRASASPSGKTVRWREKVEGERRRDDRSPDRDRSEQPQRPPSPPSPASASVSPPKRFATETAPPPSRHPRRPRRPAAAAADGDDEHPPLPPRAFFAIVGVIAAAAFAHFSHSPPPPSSPPSVSSPPVAAVASAVEWKINLDPERLERAARDVAEVVVVLMGWAFVAVRAAAETSRDVVGDVVDALAAARSTRTTRMANPSPRRRGRRRPARPDAADDDRGAVEEARETPPVHGDDASASIRDASASTRDASASGAPSAQTWQDASGGPFRVSSRADRPLRGDGRVGRGSSRARRRARGRWCSERSRGRGRTRGARGQPTGGDARSRGGGTVRGGVGGASPEHSSRR